MLKQQAILFGRFAKLLDVVMVLVAFRLAQLLRPVQEHVLSLSQILCILSLYLSVGYYLVTRYRLYSSLRTRSLPSILYQLIEAHILVGVLVAACLYLVEPRGLNRGFVFLFLFFSFVLLATEKLSVKIFLARLRGRGYNYRNVLIVGTGKRSAKFARLLATQRNWGFRIAGFLRDSGEPIPGPPVDGPILGSLEDIVSICRNHSVDEVVFCLSGDNMDGLEPYLADMDELGITVRMTRNYREQRFLRREVGMLHNEMPIMTLSRKAFNADTLFLKRGMDIVGSIAGLAVTAALYPLIALAIKIDSPGPVLFTQERVGENGRTFLCWKFRSMILDAEDRKKDLMALNEVNGAMFKIRDDPRVTRVGGFLRTTSLDELPQFWNVLRGEMSLVGARPPTPDEVARYKHWHRRRICIKPGLTGLWQVSGRSEIRDFDDIVQLDLTYVDNWSLLFDVRIILKTLKVVVTGRGSY